MLFSRQPKESPEQLANRLHREGKAADLEKELQRYSVANLSPKDKESYYHLWGITAFRRQDRAEAFRRFQEGLAACPDSQHLHFSLGQEYEYRREIDKMFDCFDKCSFPKIPSAFMLAAARYSYLWNRPDKGIRYVRGIADAYFTLGIADDHFVYVRGLPFFSQTWNYMVAFALMQRDFSETDSYLTRASQKLSDYDFKSTRRFYDCVKHDDYGPVMRELEEELAHRDSKFPAGYQHVQLAAFKARTLSDSGAAIAILDAVHIAPNDFPWLPDIVVVHKAWAYARAQEIQSEKAEVERFMAKQKLLFEPDHAVSFAFLPYQETLKSRYQNRNA